MQPVNVLRDRRAHFISGMGSMMGGGIGGTGGGEPPIITATVAPALGVLSDGDAIEDALSANIDQTGNYASTAGTISSAVVAVTVNAVSAAQTDLIEAGDVVAVTVTVTDSEANERVWSLSTTAVAIAPAQFTSNMWSVAVNELTLSSLPDDGGSALTDIEYNVDGGSWTSTGETTTGTYTITAADGTDVRIRAVNAIGAGTQSDAKTVTADAFAIGGASPELVVSYVKAEDNTTDGEYFRAVGVEATSAIVTSTVPTLRTMYDSTGVLVGNPHNLVADSAGLSNASTYLNATLSGSATETIEGVGLFTLTESTDNNQHRITQSASFDGSQRRIRFAFCYKAGTCRYLATSSYSSAQWDSPGWSWSLDTATNAFTATLNIENHTITQVGDTDMYRVEWTPTAKTKVGSSAVTVYIAMRNEANTTSTYTGTERTVLLGGFNVSYAELSMADNPDQPAGLEKYVPTTSAAVYLPRREAYYYNGTSWTRGGMLVESAAATNLITNSADIFATATFENGLVNKTSNNAGFIDGTATFCNFEEPIATNSFRASVSNVFGSNTGRYVVSVYVKNVDIEYFNIHIANSGTDYTQAVFRWNAGNVEFGAYTTLGTYFNTPMHSIENIGGEIFRVSFSVNITTGSAVTYTGLGLSNNDTNTFFAGYLGSGRRMLMGGWQVETGSVPTSYIPTTGSTVTRTAETATIAGADTPANTTAISISMKGLVTYADNSEPGEVYFYRWPGSDYELYLNTDGGRTGQVYSIIRTPSAMYSQTTSTAFSPGTNLPYAFATAFATNTSRFASGGVLQSDILETGSIPDRSSQVLNIGTKYSGFISELRMWGTDIGDSGIEEVTA